MTYIDDINTVGKTMMHMRLHHQPCDLGTWKEKEKIRIFIAPSNSYSFEEDQANLSILFQL